MEAEDGAHEVRERVVAEVRRHISDAQPLAGREWPGGRVRQLRGAHAAGGDGAELRVLLGDGQRQVSAEGVGHGVKGLHRRQTAHLQVVAHLRQHRNLDISNCTNKNEVLTLDCKNLPYLNMPLLQAWARSDSRAL